MCQLHSPSLIKLEDSLLCLQQIVDALCSKTAASTAHPCNPFLKDPCVGALQDNCEMQLLVSSCLRVYRTDVYEILCLGCSLEFVHTFRLWLIQGNITDALHGIPTFICTYETDWSVRCELRLKKQQQRRAWSTVNLEYRGFWDIDCKRLTNEISMIIDRKSDAKIRRDLTACVKEICIFHGSNKRMSYVRKVTEQTQHTANVTLCGSFLYAIISLPFDVIRNGTKDTALIVQRVAPNA